MEYRKLRFVFPAVLLEQPQAGAHHLAHILVSTRGDLAFHETVEMERQVDVVRWHLGLRVILPIKSNAAGENCRFFSFSPNGP